MSESKEKKSKSKEKIIPKTENKNILEISFIPECIDIDILKKYVKQDINANIEYYNDCNMSYRISNPTKAEWIISKAINNSKMIGSGNTFVDVVFENIYIDVTVLTLGRGQYTNEKSIMQNFSSSNNLDSLFV